MSTLTKASHPDTYLIGNKIAVDFPTEVKDVSILLTNSDTGEVIHHEIFSSKCATILYIALENCYSGRYSIGVNMAENAVCEEFAI